MVDQDANDRIGILDPEAVVDGRREQYSARRSAASENADKRNEAIMSETPARMLGPTLFSRLAGDEYGREIRRTSEGIGRARPLGAPLCSRRVRQPRLGIVFAGNWGLFYLSSDSLRVSSFSVGLRAAIV